MLPCRLALWCCLSASSPAFADALYKCSDADGAASYQSEPCAAGSTTEWQRRVQPEAEPDAAELQRRERAHAQRQADARWLSEQAGTSGRTAARPGSQRGTQNAAAQRRARCEHAKQRAAEQRDRKWKTLTYAQLSALDASVERACKR